MLLPYVSGVGSLLTVSGSDHIHPIQVAKLSLALTEWRFHSQCNPRLPSMCSLTLYLFYLTLQGDFCHVSFDVELLFLAILFGVAGGE